MDFPSASKASLPISCAKQKARGEGPCAPVQNADLLVAACGGCSCLIGNSLIYGDGVKRSFGHDARWPPIIRSVTYVAPCARG